MFQRSLITLLYCLLAVDAWNISELIENAYHNYQTPVIYLNHPSFWQCVDTSSRNTYSLFDFVENTTHYNTISNALNQSTITITVNMENKQENSSIVDNPSIPQVSVEDEFQPYYNEDVCFWNGKQLCIEEDVLCFYRCSNLSDIKLLFEEEKCVEDDEMRLPLLSPLLFLSDSELSETSDSILIVDIEDNIFEAELPIRPLQSNTKTITARIDAASSKAGSILISKSKGMSGADSLFVSNKYKYALTECKHNKWFIFSVSEMIVIDAIATSNFERFSSSVKEFVMYGSAVYPTASWFYLGYFKCDDVRHLQVFNVTTSLWLKYIKIEWLSWYGNDAICTMSEFRVYGNNMVNTMINTEFVKDVKNTGLKDIITQVTYDTEEKEVNTPLVPPEEEKKEEESIILPSTTTPLSAPVSPEFKPLYDLFTQCEKDQEEVTLSVAVLHNRTKEKFHRLKATVHELKDEINALNQTISTIESLLPDLFLKYDRIITYVHRLQTSVIHAHSWSIIVMISIVSILIYKYIQRKQRRKERQHEAETIQTLQTQILLLQKQINQLTNVDSIANTTEMNTNPINPSTKQCNTSHNKKHKSTKKRGLRT